jgi:hypothetical protein
LKRASGKEAFEEFFGINIKRAFELFFIALFLIFATQGSYFFAFGIMHLSLVLENVGFVEWIVAYVTVIIASEVSLGKWGES